MSGTRIKGTLKVAFGVGVVVLIAGLVAPYINAGAFRPAIQGSLEKSLGRKVDIDAVRLSLFSGPGFVLENVTIAEDPSYGLEPFAYVSTLQVRVRLDKLLAGNIQPLSLKLVDASLNLVKRDDGSWNAVELIERLGAPRRAPFSFIPAVQLENGRVDFKLGVKKTTFYLTDTDLSIYPEESGKIYFRFEGSPARTDRAGVGFGHLAGTANWYLKPAPSGNQLEADVNLQPSNLSELTTLFQGQDLGVHGNVSGHVRLSGPFSDLSALGDLRLEDIHRWDLLPSPGDSWRVRFQAKANLSAHTLDLSTLPLEKGTSPVMLQFRARDFMTRASWSVLASLNKAPLASILPLGKRMGIGLPTGLEMDGTVDGVLGMSSAAGLEGGVVITNAVATIPDIPPLRSASANVTISANNIHIEPAILQSNTGGTLRAGGNYNLVTQRLTADVGADEFSASAFKETTNAWFGPLEALSAVSEGNISGHFLVNSATADQAAKPVWSGQIQLADATVAIPGFAVPARRVQGKASFDAGTFDLPHFSGEVSDTTFTGSYRYSAAAKRPEHLRLEMPEADLAQLESLLAPALSDDTLLSRLPFTRRAIPLWLANRNADADVLVARLVIGKSATGPLLAHVNWQGTNVDVTNVSLELPAGTVRGTASVALSGRLPRYRFIGKLNGYPWSGGTLAADGLVSSAGTGATLLRNMKAEGAFSGQGLALGGADAFSLLSGQFSLSFDGDSPALRLTNIEARQNGDDWSGEGVSSPDGKLHLDLVSGERQLHLVTGLLDNEHEAQTAPPALR